MQAMAEGSANDPVSLQTYSFLKQIIVAESHVSGGNLTSSCSQR